jgi:hypothetical protein
MTPKHPLRFAGIAFVAGCLWGYFRNRGKRNDYVLALLQGVEWFIAYGGAAALMEGVRAFVDPEDEPESERVTHLRQIVADRTGTDG